MSRRAFTASFKLSVCKVAEEEGNRAAGRKFDMSESNVRRWRSEKSRLGEMPKTKKALRGGTAKWPQLEEDLIAWVKDKRREGQAISTVALRQKARALADGHRITDFKASPSWAYKFMEHTKPTGPFQGRHKPKEICKNAEDYSALRNFSMRLRWGICSAGNISHDFVIALTTLPAEDHTVSAVAARSQEKAQEFAEKHQIPKAYGGYEALAADDNIDIVYIGAVNHVHLSLCRLFLGSGKNVLCEKPLGLNRREVQEMVDLAKMKNVFFMEAWWTRFFPATVKLREILASGLIGDVKAFSASFGLPISCQERIINKDVGGGGLLDLGVYPVQAALMVFGEAPISCKTTGTLTESGVDESTATTLLFPNKAVATLSSSTVVSLPNEAHITGTKGHIKVPSPFWCPTKLEVTTSMGMSDSQTVVYEFPLPTAEKSFLHDNSAGLRYEAECVRQCLMEGLKECPSARFEESLLAAEILDSARRDIGYRLPADDL